MSTTNTDLNSLILQDPDSVSTSIQENYVLVASACLYYYDYILTLSTEVSLVWRSPRNLATYFYLAIRYGFFFQMILRLARNMHSESNSSSGITVEVCTTSLFFLIIFNIINFTTISAFVATRLFAMYGRNWHLGTFMFIFGTLSQTSLTQVASFAFRSVVAPWPLARCISVGPDSGPWIDIVARYGPIALSTTNIVYEGTCLALTIAKTFGLWRAQRRTGVSTALSSLLLRDETLCFGVLSLHGILNIVASLATNDVLPGFCSANTDISRVVVPILTIRFILHLRRMSQPDHDIHLMSTGVDSLRFASEASDHFPESPVERNGSTKRITTQSHSAETSTEGENSRLAVW